MLATFRPCHNSSSRSERVVLPEDADDGRVQHPRWETTNDPNKVHKCTVCHVTRTRPDVKPTVGDKTDKPKWLLEVP